MCITGSITCWLLDSKQVSEVKSLSRVRLFATPWTVPYQAPPSVGIRVPKRQACSSTGDTQTLKGRSGSVSVGPLGPGSHKVLFEPSSLASMGCDSKCDFAPPTVFLWLLLCPWTFGIFFGGLQHSPVDGCSSVSCDFGVLAGQDEHISFYSAICVRHFSK